MKIRTGFFGIVAALALAAGAASAQVVVSSKIDTEGGVLGNVILAVLNANDIPTTDRIQLGGTPVVRQAIAAGQIDIYPEYTGNAAFFFERADDPVWKDAGKGYATAKQLDYDANKIVWLAPSPANNTWAIAVRKDVADENKLVTLSDFGQYVSWRRQDHSCGLRRVRELGCRPAGFPGDLRVHAQARSVDHPVGRRHRRHHRRRGEPDQRRQCGDGLRHRRRDRTLGAYRSGRRQGRPARLPAGADHP